MAQGVFVPADKDWQGDRGHQIHKHDCLCGPCRGAFVAISKVAIYRPSTGLSAQSMEIPAPPSTALHNWFLLLVLMHDIINKLSISVEQ